MSKRGGSTEKNLINIRKLCFNIDLEKTRHHDIKTKKPKTEYSQEHVLVAEVKSYKQKHLVKNT